MNGDEKREKGKSMNKHVDFSNEDVVIVRKQQLEQFVKQSYVNTDNPKYRFCLHESPENMLQEMFIVRRYGEYCRPDRHDGIPETHMIIKGEEAVILFDEKGEILDIIFLGEGNEVLAYRVNAPVYHMTVTLSEVAIDYEVKPGPFTSETNIYPDWAPAYDEKDKIEEFMRHMVSEIDRRRINEQ